METNDPALLLLDTHALVWLMFGNKRLGPQARAAIREASLRHDLLVSAITPWEIGVLTSKGRIDLHQETMSWVSTALRLPGLTLAPLEPEIAVASTRLPFEMHGDPADRILVATARRLGAALVTADEALLGLAAGGHVRVMDARV